MRYGVIVRFFTNWQFQFQTSQSFTAGLFENFVRQMIYLSLLHKKTLRKKAAIGYKDTEVLGKWHTSFPNLESALGGNDIWPLVDGLPWVWCEDDRAHGLPLPNHKLLGSTQKVIRLQPDQINMAVLFWYLVQSDDWVCCGTVAPYTGQVKFYKIPETHDHE